MTERLIASTSNCNARDAERLVPHQPGYYAIFIDNADALRDPFRNMLKDQDSRLIYIGIAKRSLQTRLVKQDLRHCAPSSFFRSLGAVLNYLPPPGSLIGRKNQNNYAFSSMDRRSIIQWIDQHLLVSWLCDYPALRLEEERAIQALFPLMNLQSNPKCSPELKLLRENCRAVAKQAPLAVGS